MYLFFFSFLCCYSSVKFLKTKKESLIKKKRNVCKCNIQQNTNIKCIVCTAFIGDKNVLTFLFTNLHYNDKREVVTLFYLYFIHFNEVALIWILLFQTQLAQACKAHIFASILDITCKGQLKRNWLLICEYLKQLEILIIILEDKWIFYIFSLVYRERSSP